MKRPIRAQQTEFWRGDPQTRLSTEPAESFEAVATGRVVTELELESVHHQENDFSNATVYDHVPAPASGVGDKENTMTPVRPVVARFQQQFSERERHTPRFSMARYLRLNGSFQHDREPGRGMILPRRAFRPRFSFLSERHLPVDLPPKLGRAGGGLLSR